MVAINTGRNLRYAGWAAYISAGSVAHRMRGMRGDMKRHETT